MRCQQPLQPTHATGDAGSADDETCDHIEQYPTQTHRQPVPVLPIALDRQNSLKPKLDHDKSCQAETTARFCERRDDHNDDREVLFFEELFAYALGLLRVLGMNESSLVQNKVVLSRRSGKVCDFSEGTINKLSARRHHPAIRYGGMSCTVPAPVGSVNEKESNPSKLQLGLTAWINSILGVIPIDGRSRLASIPFEQYGWKT
jgi:hypothetical protein